MFQIQSAPSPMTTLTWARTPTPLVRFRVDPAGELGGRFDRSSVRSGFFIAHGAPLIIGGGLSEDTTEFGLAGVCPSVFSLAASSLGFLGHHRRTCAIHLDIHLVERLTNGDGQLQLHGLLDDLLAS